METRTGQAKAREIFSVRDAEGVVGDDANDDTVGVQKALDGAAGNELFFPPGEYRVTGDLTPSSNTRLRFAKGAVLKLAVGITNKPVIKGTGLSGLSFENMVVEGNGAAGVSNIQLTNCDDVEFLLTRSTKAGSHGIFLDGCTNVRTMACTLSNNYFYGIEDKSGTSNKHIGNVCDSNGDTGVATSSGGRGINIWMGKDQLVQGCSLTNSTEYGFREYSETGDATASVTTRLIGNYFEDNAAADIVVYNEATTLERHVLASNHVVRSTDPSLGGCVVIQGKHVHVSDTHVYKDGTMATGFAFQFYQTEHCSIRGSSAYNVSSCVEWSNADNCLLDGFRGVSVKTAFGSAGLMGGSNIVRNAEFYHGGAGTADVAIVNYNATGKNRYDTVHFDGFHTGLYLNDEAAAVFNCTSVNSGFAGLRKSGNDLSLQEFGGNSWDLTSPFEISALSKNASTHNRAWLFFPTAPANLTWRVGDTVLIQSPNVGEASMLRCTTAGTPGTWTVTMQHGPAAGGLSGAPPFLGAISIVTGEAYIGTGTSGSGDWKKITP